MLLWSPLAFGAYQGWALSVTFVLIGVAAACWLATVLHAGRLEWRRTPLDLPVLLLLLLGLVQLGIGNRQLVDWALAPAQPVASLAAEFPAPFLTVGTVAPRRTATALLIFAGYAAVYFLVTQTVRTREQVGRLVRALLATGALLAFLGLLDYLTGETWLLRWREHPFAARLSATFVNPDHFAAWLVMLIALGSGWLTARGSGDRRGPSLSRRLSVRRLREQAARRHLPLLGVVVMGVALVFTLSRGGLLSVVAALLSLLGMLVAVRRGRASLVTTGVLLIAVLAYGGWIGFDPLVARLSATSQGTGERLTQYVASLPLAREFPVLGVGLGGYREIYVRHQPAAHQPGLVSYPFAHSDLLQLGLELGPLGVALALFLAWRLGVDLIGAHLLGRGACPVDGGEGEQAARSDRYSVGIAIGALAGVAGLVVHSGLDFSARIPAVGILAAALLGLATVTLHTRLGRGNAQLLSGVRTLPLHRPPVAVAVAVLGLALLGGWTWTWVRAGRVASAEAALVAAPGADWAARTEAVLALDPQNFTALLARARARHADAVRAWESPAASGPDRALVAREVLAGARADVRALLAVTPTSPWLHLELAWVEATDAVVRGQSGLAGLATALTHGTRAVALARDGALFYAALARLAYSVPELGLPAAREAVRRQPALLAEMVALYRPLGLTGAEWLDIAPATAVDRLALGVLLEAWRLGPDSLVAYRGAVAVATPSELGACRWVLAEALGRAGSGDEAVALLRAAVAADPGNPELIRSLGVALARTEDPEALDRLRAALGAMERRAPRSERRPFVLADPRLAELIARVAPDLDRTARYRRALAAYLTERRLWEQALPVWRALTAEEPADAGARFGLGLAHEGLGAVDEAVEAFRAAVALEPGSPRYRRRLAERLWQRELYFQAINEWRVLVEQQPADVPARLALGSAFEKVGQPVDAYRQYREVLALDPGQTDAGRALARLEGRRR